MSSNKTETEDEILIDVSRMNAGKKEALMVAESAREREWKSSQMVSDWFQGKFNVDSLFPFPLPRWTEEFQLFYNEFRQFLKAELDPEEVDKSREIPVAVIKRMAEMKIFAMKIPKEYGGLGFSQIEYNRIMMLLASHCASTAVLVSAHQSIGVPQPLKMFGTKEQKEKYFPQFARGAISAFALTEPDVGSDPAKMTTEAVPDESGQFYILNGIKQWCTNGPIADVLVVMARTPSKMVAGAERQQITAFIVEKSMAGIEVLQRCEFMGLSAIQNGLLKFNNVKVPAENIILGAGKGLKLALATLNTGRLTLPAACTGAAKQCLAIVRDFGSSRVQWGSPVGLHEEGQSKLHFIASYTLAMEAVTWFTSYLADQKDVDIRLEAAMAKYFCSEACWSIVDQTMQFRGGRGYEKASSLKQRGEKPFPVERMLRDSRINLIIEGTSEIMRLFMAREAMDPFIQKLSPLMKKGVSVEKILSGLKIGTHFGIWSLTQLMAQFIPANTDSSFTKEFSWVKRCTHQLALNLFMAMARYQDKLEKKQLLLGSLMDIGTFLFATATTLSYAESLEKEGNQNARELALIFFDYARDKVDHSFASLNKRRKFKGKALSKKILDGQCRWLEDGVVPVD